MISFKQKALLAPFVDINTKKESCNRWPLQKRVLWKVGKCIFGKTMANERNILKVLFITGSEGSNLAKEHSKKVWCCKVITKFDIWFRFRFWTFRNKKVMFDKPIHLGFAVLGLSRQHMYETCFDILQNFFGQENLPVH